MIRTVHFPWAMTTTLGGGGDVCDTRPPMPIRAWRYCGDASEYCAEGKETRIGDASVVDAGSDDAAANEQLILLVKVVFDARRAMMVGCFVQIHVEATCSYCAVGPPLTHWKDTEGVRGRSVQYILIKIRPQRLMSTEWIEWNGYFSNVQKPMQAMCTIQKDPLLTCRYLAIAVSE
jgi:hypothetical protein